MKTEQEVIIVGGSYAGLSAAMALGRSLRNVLVIDSGKPCNAPTPHSHNFITHDGEKPAVIAAKAKAQVQAYPTVQFLEDEVTTARKTGNGFEVTTAGGQTISSKKILFATGVKDLLPDLDGFAACWGISVLHCPYCHGYEVRGKKTAILANGDMAAHIGMLLTQWTKDLTLFSNGPLTLAIEQVEKLKKHGIKIVEEEIVSLQHEKGYLQNIIMKNGETLPYEVMYARVPLEQHCKVPVDLGCELTEMGLLKIDMMGKTSIPGIYAAGDNTSLARTVSGAVGSGTMAGAAINMELVSETF